VLGHRSKSTETDSLEILVTIKHGPGIDCLKSPRVGGLIPPLATIHVLCPSESSLHGDPVKHLSYPGFGGVAGGVKNWAWFEQA